MDVLAVSDEGSRCAVCGGHPDGLCAICHRAACADCVAIVRGPLGPVACCVDCGTRDVEAEYRDRIVRDVVIPALGLAVGLAALAAIGWILVR